MDLIVDNYIIKTPIINILKQVKSELNNTKLKDIKCKHDDIIVTCPFHKGGQENHPSCGIYCGDDPNIPKGSFNCFTCHESGSLIKFIGECFDADENFGKEWLLSRFGTTLIKEEDNYLEPIYLNKPVSKEYLNENILNNLKEYHPYMDKRKLNPKIIKKFKVKYNPKEECIVFPIWDEKNNLVMLTSRSINSKHFYIPENIDKPVYLLNYILKEKIREVYVCESQINTLYAWSLGLPAIGLLGTGSKNQYNILNRSDINHYILALDADEAGRIGIKKFLNNIRKDVNIDVLDLPLGKDLNDLSEDEIFNTKILNIYEFLEKYSKKYNKKLYDN